MKGPAHGAMVAGMSSCVVAGWIRHQTRKEYDPEVTPPGISERTRQRFPLVVAGLGFTGLSTAVSYSFDNVELSILADANQPQIGSHRDLHTLPYLGGAIGAAHLIRHSSAQFGRWIGSHLGLEDYIEEIVEKVDDLANWLIDSSGFGVAGHLLGDVPTKGRGGTALRLLHPITNQNFSLNWVSATSEPINKYLTIAGMILAGVAWSFSGLHICSWEPPEKAIRRYIQEIGQCDSFAEAMEMVIDDLESLFQRFVSWGKDLIWEHSLFEQDPNSIRSNPGRHWYRMKFDTDRIFGVANLNQESLTEKGILPPKLTAKLNNRSIYSADRFEEDPNRDSIISELATSSAPLLESDPDLAELVEQADTEGGTPIKTSNGSEADSLYSDCTSKGGSSLFDSEDDS